MPKSSRSKTKPAPSTMPTAEKLDRIDYWLDKMLTAFPAKGLLEVDERRDWHRDLNVFSLEAIDYAFDAHRRNAIFFPIYGQIIDLCISYDPPAPPSTFERIPAEQRGKGYGWVDIKWMMRRISGVEPAHFPNGNARLNTALVQARALAGTNARTVIVERQTPKVKAVDYERLLDELDMARGGPPEWRK